MQASWLQRKPNWRELLPLFATCILSVSVGFSQKLITSGYLFNSDPTCHEINGKFFLFTTQDPFTTQFIAPNAFYKGMFAYHAFSTTDFDHWVDHGSILTGRDVTWNSGKALWDGDAGISAKQRFFAYAPFRVHSAGEENYGIFDIGVFTATTPIGPYENVFSAPMRQPDGSALEGLSPAVVRNADDIPYLIWGSGYTAKHEVMLARLKPDMTQLAEPLRKLNVPETDACGNLEYFESPILFRRGTKWYLSSVAYKSRARPGCDTKGSYVDYVVASSIFGPFDGPVRHLVYPAGDGEESVQQGICVFHGQMYLAYHVPYETVVDDHDHHRQVAVTKLKFRLDGSLEPIHPGRDLGAGTPGVTHLTLDAFAPRREAAEFQARLNAAGEPGVDGEYQMKMGDRGYLCFHNVDFGNGAAGFRVEISSENAGLQDGVLEARIDNPAGKIVSRVRVSATGGARAYQILKAPLLAHPRGVHDLFLAAHGMADPDKQRLFNVTWVSFIPPK